MAYIAIYDTAPNSVTLYLGGLDTSWNGGTRTANWYLSANGSSKSYTGHSIPNGVSSSSTVTISGLEPDTEYTVTCYVYHSSTLLATIRGFVTTEEETSSSPWSAWQEEQLDITTYEQSRDIYNYTSGNYRLEPYNVHRYTVVFDYSGYAHFYTISDIDTIGYLSDEYDWNNDNSGPLYEIASDDDSGDNRNFDIKYYVTAGVEYNIYVRGYSGGETGAVTLFVTEPWNINSSSYGTLSAEKSESVSLKACTLYCRSMYFANSGTVTISTTGSVDTRGWLGTTSQWDRGEPTSYIASDDDSGSGSNFSMSFDVEAGRLYYVWFRGYDAGYTGSITLKITPPAEKVRPSNFSWTYIKTQGGSFNLTATEWNNLTARINAFREYRGLSNYSFTRAYSGNDFTAAMYNQAVNAIKGISGYGSYLSTVSSGDTVTAAGLNLLRDELNAIP